MSKVYVVIKAAIGSVDGIMLATTEKVFTEAAKAQAWLALRPAVWEETINGDTFHCERAVHEADLE